MSAVLAPPRLRGPGLAWVPAVLRERATWRNVWRFTWAGPLMGGLPYVWMPVTILFAYAIGVVPAVLAGLLCGRGFDAFWMAVCTLHGVPAAAALAVMQKPVRTERAAEVS